MVRRLNHYSSSTDRSCIDVHGLNYVTELLFSSQLLKRWGFQKLKQNPSYSWFFESLLAVLEIWLDSRIRVDFLILTRWSLVDLFIVEDCPIGKFHHQVKLEHIVFIEILKFDRAFSNITNLKSLVLIQVTLNEPFEFHSFHEFGFERQKIFVSYLF